MLVTYFFQGDVGESLDCPNAFVINGNDKVTFEQFMKHFPSFEIASLQFRFRMDDPEFGYVWVDVSERSTVLPVYSGQICTKILRLDSVVAAKRKILLRRKLIPAENPLVQKVQAQFSQTSFGSKNSIATDNKRATSSTSNSSSQPPAKPVKPIPKIPTSTSDRPSSNTVERDSGIQSPFFETDGYAPLAPPSVSAPAPNIFDDDDDAGPAETRSPLQRGTPLPPSSSSGAMDIDDGISDLKIPEGPNRAVLAARKEEAIEDKVKDALEFKKEMDKKKEQEMIDFDAAREKHEKAIQAWSTNNKEKRNVRNLLSTMHTVLPADSKWKPIGLGDLLESSQVKKQYRKAMLVVHPDHTINLDSESKFICKRIFEAINEAYDDFLKKEGV
jgi:hypothetical protein